MYYTIFYTRSKLQIAQNWRLTDYDVSREATSSHGYHLFRGG
ncbi:MAG: hypothetical protein ABIF17_03060 [Patescibacteria group bacterium]